MKKILITGGAGYVGSKLVPVLLNLNYEVTVFDLMIYGENVLSHHKNLKMIKGDIRNIDLLKKVIPGHNSLIHLACISNDTSFERRSSLISFRSMDALTCWSLFLEMTSVTLVLALPEPDVKTRSLEKMPSPFS